MNETFADSFFWSLFYNGCEESVKMLAGLLESCDRLFLDNDKRESIYANNAEMLLLWMVLVQQFGDYGSSPRSGWIEDTRAAAAFLREQMRRTWLWEDDSDE